MIYDKDLAEPVICFRVQPGHAPKKRQVTYVPASVLWWLHDRTPEEWARLLSGQVPEVAIGTLESL